MRTKIILNLMLVSFLLGCSDMGDEVIDYHNKILFSSSRSGKGQLYMMNPDGSNIRQLTFGYSHSAGRWSPDAKRIVSNTDEGGSTAGFAMVVMNVDGTNRRLLRYGSQMSWSPDGTKILFSYCTDCELGGRDIGLFIIDVDGQNGARLPVDGGAPTWAPDGRTVAFVGLDSPIIRLIDYPSFGNLRTIGPSGAVEPEWGRTEREIVFSSTNGGFPVNGEPTSNIFIMNIDGSDVRRITDLRTGEQCSTPRWSPDGNEIVFLLHATDGSRTHFLYAVKKDGTNLRRIIDDASVSSADWSP